MAVVSMSGFTKTGITDVVTRSRRTRLLRSNLWSPEMSTMCDKKLLTKTFDYLL